jgi:hypothetical protein
MNQRGTALIAALTIAMILIPLGTFVAVQCRNDFLIQRNLRSEVEAFYVAEAGLEHAVAEIPPGRSFDRVLFGPDRIAGTNDDGVFPFAGGPPAAFPYAPLRYDVHVTDAGDGMVQILSQGTGKNGASKVVTALVARSPLPVTPAALYAEGDVMRLALGSSGFLLSGFDHRLTDSATTPTATQAAIPALGTPSIDWERSLRARLSSGVADALVGAGGSPSIATVASLDLQTYASAMMQRPERVILTAVTANDLPTLGTEAAPQLSIVTGDCDVAGRVSGNGILVVQGALHVTGNLAFAGLVLALGGVVFEAGSDATISGALWRGVSVDDRLELSGAGAIAYSSAALGAVDTAFPGLLPHAAVVVGWQEQL